MRCTKNLETIVERAIHTQGFSTDELIFADFDETIIEDSLVSDIGKAYVKSLAKDALRSISHGKVKDACALTKRIAKIGMTYLQYKADPTSVPMDQIIRSYIGCPESLIDAQVADTHRSAHFIEAVNRYKQENRLEKVGVIIVSRNMDEPIRKWLDLNGHSYAAEGIHFLDVYANDVEIQDKKVELCQILVDNRKTNLVDHYKVMQKLGYNAPYFGDREDAKLLGIPVLDVNLKAA